MPRHGFYCEACIYGWEDVVPAGLVCCNICPKCGSSEDVYIDYGSWKTVQGIADIPEYYDNGMGVKVGGRADRRQKMKDRGVEECGDSSEQRKRDDMMGEARAKKRERLKSKDR